MATLRSHSGGCCGISETTLKPQDIIQKKVDRLLTTYGFQEVVSEKESKIVILHVESTENMKALKKILDSNPEQYRYAIIKGNVKGKFAFFVTSNLARVKSVCPKGRSRRDQCKSYPPSFTLRAVHEKPICIAGFSATLNSNHSTRTRNLKQVFDLAKEYTSSYLVLSNYQTNKTWKKEFKAFGYEPVLLSKNPNSHRNIVVLVKKSAIITSAFN